MIWYGSWDRGVVTPRGPVARAQSSVQEILGTVALSTYTLLDVPRHISWNSKN